MYLSVYIGPRTRDFILIETLDPSYCCKAVLLCFYALLGAPQIFFTRNKAVSMPPPVWLADRELNTSQSQSGLVLKRAAICRTRYGVQKRALRAVLSRII